MKSLIDVYHMLIHVETVRTAVDSSAETVAVAEKIIEALRAVTLDDDNWLDSMEASLASDTSDAADKIRQYITDIREGRHTGSHLDVGGRMAGNLLK